jgi:hypothetical protein
VYAQPSTCPGPPLTRAAVISSFVRDALRAAAAAYVAPRSLALDLQELITGDGTRKGLAGAVFRAGAR